MENLIMAISMIAGCSMAGMSMDKKQYGWTVAFSLLTLCSAITTGKHGVKK